MKHKDVLYKQIFIHTNIQVYIQGTAEVQSAVVCMVNVVYCIPY